MRILLLGSCVTRDAFELQPTDKPLTIVDYFARSALNSATDSAVFAGVDVERIESPFQRRIVDYDLRGGFMERLHRSDFDLLVLDAIDERFDLLVSPTGAVATRSNEFVRSGYDASNDSVVVSGSSEGKQRWEEGWTRLLETLEFLGRLADLRINRALWADHVEDGSDFPAMFTPAKIASSNEYLTWMYDRAARDLPSRQFYDHGNGNFVGASQHRWGVSPFHFTQSYYDSLLGHMLADSPANTRF